MKHKADGLYYMSRKLARDNGACAMAWLAWEQLYGWRQVPVTLAQMTEFCCRYRGAAYWLTNRLYRKRLLTVRQRDHYERLSSRAWSARPAEEARVIMNMLAARARNEGRLL